MKTIDYKVMHEGINVDKDEAVPSDTLGAVGGIDLMTGAQLDIHEELNHTIAEFSGDLDDTLAELKAQAKDLEKKKEIAVMKERIFELTKDLQELQLSEKKGGATIGIATTTSVAEVGGSAEDGCQLQNQRQGPGCGR